MVGDQHDTYRERPPVPSHSSLSPRASSTRSMDPASGTANIAPTYRISNDHGQPESPSSRSILPFTSVKRTHDTATQQYYDPTADGDDRFIGRNGNNWNNSMVNHQRRQSYNEYEIQRMERPRYSSHSRYNSSLPTQIPSPATYHSTQPTSRIEPPNYSPVSPKPVLSHYSPDPTNSQAVNHNRTSSYEAPARSADPMSLSNIISRSDNERPLPEPRANLNSPNGTTDGLKRNIVVKTEIDVQPYSPYRTSVGAGSALPPKDNRINYRNSTSTIPQTVLEPAIERPPSPTAREVDAEMRKIERLAESELYLPGLEKYRREWKDRTRKRTKEVEARENYRRKRRRTAQMMRFHEVLGTYAALSKEQYTRAHSDEAWQAVQEQEVANEKERKKDMQRKRRREKTLLSEYQKRDEAIEKAQQAADDEEKERFIKDAQKAEKKAKATSQLLHGGLPSKEFKEVISNGPNLGGGTMSSFQTSEDLPKETSSGKRASGRMSTRPKKSKEQKQAEKDSAAAAQEAMERGDELPVIAPKEGTRTDGKKKESSAKEAIPETEVVPYVSKAYNQMYDAIWRDIARKDISKVCRIKENTLVVKQSNLRKTAQLASKEARRWQLRTNKSMKDVQARAKRGMREMLNFWKRNEREERDQRKMAERQELENARKEEADREANRQKRKLNFLISQTELYSHFIGKKVKTAEVERSTDDVTNPEQPVEDSKNNDMPEEMEDSVPKVTDFDNLDFDNEDESVLRKAAMVNAQNAVKEAQDRARAFNEPDEQLQSQFDEGEMNFQNPTSLQNMDVDQPLMLACQLKEYQLKGLNWLVNLYEQGINGILADEMGLGKTVQSISVMAYLAEAHDIWGPFLVIAPASTLHNWQQEITRFVPELKVLPYWGTARDRKVLRKFWDRKHITYRRDSPFHVLVTSYQLVVQDAQYFQKIRWQYMILDEAQAIKSSQSSRWKSLLGFYCRNRLLLTGTPIQNNMQELWALLHFIMPSLFDSHDEFSDWFSKDIESHAQSNTKLNEDQLKRLHMILKPFMLRRIKKHVQKELGDKIELDVFCDLTYRQRAYYSNLRNKISIMDLIEKAAVGSDDQDTATLMNLVMQFRKVCNHPDLFERADIASPMAFSQFADTVSFIREGQNVEVSYSVRNCIDFSVPRLVGDGGGRIDLPDTDNAKAGWRRKYLQHMMSIWSPENILQSSYKDGAFSWLRFIDTSAGEITAATSNNIFERIVEFRRKPNVQPQSFVPRSLIVIEDDDRKADDVPLGSLLNISRPQKRNYLTDVTDDGPMGRLLNISRQALEETGLNTIEQCAKPRVSAPPVNFYCSSQNACAEQEAFLFNVPIRRALYGVSEEFEEALLERKIDPADYPVANMLPAPDSIKARFNHINVPSMRRFVTDSGKLAKLDSLLKKLREGGHRVLLYFQMTRMIDLMEEYLTYRNYKYCRLDGSTKLEDRRDTVADFQTRPEIFVFLLSTRAGGLGINLTAADTVIFYDSDWNPTIDSQAMDRAHRLGQTKQVRVYRMITRGTIEERIRKRALQKEEVQRVVISGGAGGGVDFNTRSRENRTKDIAMWLADDDQAAEIEKKEAELAAAAEAGLQVGGKKRRGGQQQQSQKKKADLSLDDMYHEGEGKFDDESNKPSGAATPIPTVSASEITVKRKSKGASKKAKTLKQRLAIADGDGDVGMG